MISASERKGVALDGGLLPKRAVWFDSGVGLASKSPMGTGRRAAKIADGSLDLLDVGGNARYVAGEPPKMLDVPEVGTGAVAGWVEPKVKPLGFDGSLRSLVVEPAEEGFSGILLSS